MRGGESEGNSKGSQATMGERVAGKLHKTPRNAASLSTCGRVRKVRRNRRGTRKTQHGSWHLGVREKRTRGKRMFSLLERRGEGEK